MYLLYSVKLTDDIDVSVPDGKPVIGPVPGLSNVLLATGHEGGGLSMVNMLSYSAEDI